MVSPARLAEAIRRALEHDALRDRDAPQRGQIRCGETARIDVRQQSCLVEHRATCTREIRDRRLVTETIERSPRGWIPQLGLVSECEEHLLAVGGVPCTCDRQNLLDR